jgi:hypothetical protein
LQGDGENNHGGCLSRGIGIERNMFEAVRYYELCGNKEIRLVDGIPRGVERTMGIEIRLAFHTKPISNATSVVLLMEKWLR